MRSRTKGVTVKRVEKSGKGGRARTMAGAGPADLPYGSRGIPTAHPTRGVWALISPAQVDPASPLMIQSGNHRFNPEKKGDTRREEWVPTWRISSPSVKDHVKNIVISKYPRKNQTTSQVAAALKGLGATANAVRQNRPTGMRKRRWK